MNCRRRTSLTGRAARAAAALLVIAMITEAKSTDPHGGTPALTGAPLPGLLDSPAFAAKATGDWWGARQQLKQAGVSFDSSLILEGFKNFQGGLGNPDLIGASTFDLNLELDTERLIQWPGGMFYADLEDHAGQDPSTDLVGDLQVFDKQNAPRYLQLFELWYQQKLLDDKLRLKFGKVDANSEFSVIDNGLPFLNSSTQVSPTVFVFPTTPDPMPALNVFLTPNKSYYASLGAFYANRSVGFGNFIGHPQDAQSSASGMFFIGETGLRWQKAPLLEHEGNLRLGSWGHTGTFTRLDGSSQQGVYGYYAILDQTLWQPDGATEHGRGVRTFLEYGRTQSTVNPTDEHFGWGVTWTGLFPGRSADIAGFSPQYAHVSPPAGLPHSFELALEGFYRLQLTPWATLMPDLQYIIHPGGQYPNALVGTIRLTVHF
ncbi:MAG: carbohydrate porin [Candidatus Omnitrophica bacterium]|nr:carbohydrate porin [Candidatus Omnitrophota bacterium]